MSWNEKYESFIMGWIVGIILITIIWSACKLIGFTTRETGFVLMISGVSGVVQVVFYEMQRQKGESYELKKS